MTGVITESSLRKIKQLDFQQLRLDLLTWKLNKQTKSPPASRRGTPGANILITSKWGIRDMMVIETQ